jgi:GAF domain-containing protein
VALSGETLAINGEPLKRFKVASLGLSALVVPIKIQQEVIGLLEVVRKTNQPFESTTQALLGAVADYASISLVHARLFHALQESVDSAQAGEKKKMVQLQELRQEMQSLLQLATYPIDLLLTGKMGKLTSEQKKALESTQDSLKRAVQLVTDNRPS